jgi:putative methionine-R-sulfoxide reductase with GAF domain
VTEHKNKPVLDEHSFEKLLEAAHVLQEHTRKRRELEERMESRSERLREQESAEQAPLQRSQPEVEEASRPSDYTLTLAEIVEAQRQIQARHLALDKAMAVVAEKVARITSASGAAIAMLEGKTVRYVAGAGVPALPLDTEVPLATAICAASVRTGQVIRSEDVNTEILFDPEPCHQRGILSLVTVPIYHDGDIVGGLELYFDKIHGFAEQDIHTCQLLAGLVTEAIGRNAESTLKKSMAAERSTMLAAIEKLQPNLAALAGDAAAATARTNTDASAVTAAGYSCWNCAGRLLNEELFCGKCGAPRVSEGQTPSMQSKLASAWHMQQASREAIASAPTNGTSPIKDLAPTHARFPETPGAVAAHLQGHGADTEADGDNLLEPFSLPELQAEGSDALSERAFGAGANEDALAVSLSSNSQADRGLLEQEGVETSSTALVKPKPDDVVWTSAAKTRDFLESLTGTRTPSGLARFWHSRRGDFYLAVAVILVVGVIRWGIWSNHSVGATSRGPAVSGSATHGKQPAPDADLSTFDKLLIALGLADAPEPPEYKGNPEVQVWVDLQTALYYCPGSDLYGKTVKGKLTSQRDAQLDQFEPANRKPCD